MGQHQTRKAAQDAKRGKIFTKNHTRELVGRRVWAVAIRLPTRVCAAVDTALAPT